MVLDISGFPENRKTSAMKMCEHFAWNYITKKGISSDRQFHIYINDVSRVFNQQTQLLIMKHFSDAPAYRCAMTGITDKLHGILSSGQGENGFLWFTGLSFYALMNPSPSDFLKLKAFWNMTDTFSRYLADKAPGTGLYVYEDKITPFDLALDENTLEVFNKENMNDSAEMLLLEYYSSL